MKPVLHRWAHSLAFSAAAACATAALSSFAPIPDPSLLAAPLYEPEKWNDVSLEDLAAYHARHAKGVEAIVAKSYEAHKTDLSASFHSGHAPLEKTFYALMTLAETRAANKTLTVPELAGAIAPAYGLGRLEMMSLLLDMEDIYHPRGIQQANNCYAYSVNDDDRAGSAAGYQAQPGERTRGGAWAHTVDPMKAANFNALARQTIAGNVSDGMIFTGRNAQSKEGYYRVALFLRPIAEDVRTMAAASDYHYVRQDRDGGWSHKFGAFFVTKLDYANRPIVDPRTADMGGYKFIGFFLVPEGGLDVGPAGEKKTRPGSRPAYAGTPSPAPAAS